MKRSRLAKEEIIAALREEKAGMSSADVFTQAQRNGLCVKGRSGLIGLL